MPTHSLYEHYLVCRSLALDFTGDMNVAVTGLSCDSRNLRPGNLFVAIKGERNDGRKYIQQAIGAGASGIVYENDTPLAVAAPSIRVVDDYAALARLAEFHYHYPASQMKTIGVTGTNGKTTTTFLINDIFRYAGFNTGLLGTVKYAYGDRILNAERTTPTPVELQQLFADMRREGVEIITMEVSSHALMQERMGTLAFDLGVFTNLTPEHLDYHGDMENYYQAKKKLFTRYLSTQSLAVINVDDHYGRRLKHELSQDANLPASSLCSYGFNPQCDCYPIAVRSSMIETYLQLKVREQIFDVTCPLIGRFNIYNLMAAIGVAVSVNIPIPVIKESLRQFRGVPGRLQQINGRDGINLFIDYAHTGDALESILTTLRPLAQSRLILVFGCGGDRDPGKRPVMGAIAARLADQIIVTSDNPRREDPEKIMADIQRGIPASAPAVYIANRRQALTAAIAMAESNDTIVIAGKGHEEYQEIKGIKHEFSDYQICRQLLAETELLSTP